MRTVKQNWIYQNLKTQQKKLQLSLDVSYSGKFNLYYTNHVLDIHNFTDFVKQFFIQHHNEIVNCFWVLIEIHIFKIIGLLMITMCISEVR